MASDRVVLGRVVGAHGLRGQLRVRFLGDDPTNLARARELWLAAGADDPAPPRFAVLRVQPGRAGEVRLALEGLRHREDADALRGRLVVGDVADLQPLPPGEHYWFELVGCRVVATDGQEVGSVVALWETGGHDLLVVETGEGRRVLLPVADDLLREVDVAGRRLVMEIVPGLLSAELPREGA